MDGSGGDNQGKHGGAQPPRRKANTRASHEALSIIAVEETTAAAGYRVKPLDLRLIYDALSSRQGTLGCLVWILEQMKHRDIRTPGAYIVEGVEKGGFVEKWRAQRHEIDE